MNKFTKGDVVVLKSGGPKMTISGQAHQLMTGAPIPGSYTVVWFENGKPEYNEFDENLLELAK